MLYVFSPKNLTFKSCAEDDDETILFLDFPIQRLLRQGYQVQKNLKRPNLSVRSFKKGQIQKYLKRPKV